MYGRPALPRVERVEEIVLSLPCYAQADKNLIITQISNLMYTAPLLKQSRDTFTHNDGTQHVLLKLSGCIPTSYTSENGQTSTYNTPIIMWFPQGYPRVPPLVYVDPAHDMAIVSRHQFVDPTGLVQLPYQLHWKAQQSTPAELITMCCAAFSEDPPLRMKVPDPVPLPMFDNVSPFQPSGRSPPPAYSNAYTGAQAGAEPPPPYPMGPSMGRPNLRPTETPEQVKQSLITALEVKLRREFEHFNKKIRSETSSAFKAQERLDQGQETLKHTKEQLEARLQDLSVIQTEYEEKKLGLLKRIQEEHIAKEAAAALSNAAGSVSGNDPTTTETEVDELVKPADVWSGQLFKCVAEAAATEDTLYQLDKALSRETIDLKVFMKEVRKLARKQFTQKALAMKIMDKQMGSRGA